MSIFLATYLWVIIGVLQLILFDLNILVFPQNSEICIFAEKSGGDSPEQMGKVTIAGKGVRSSIKLKWYPGLTLKTAIEMAGGTSGFEEGTAIISRQGKRTSIFLNPLFRSKAPDPVLYPGDSVEIP